MRDDFNGVEVVRVGLTDSGAESRVRLHISPTRKGGVNLKDVVAPR